jgi:hypothetical protein
VKPPATARSGFTLFEVSISLVILTFGVLTLMMLFPSGLKAQQLSRFQIYASAKAVEMIDAFSSVQTNNPMMDSEGPNPWDASGSYRAMAPDLETRIATYRFGLFPLPVDIARRLDSDGDEIQQILGEGGYVYYSQPLATTGFNEAGGASVYPNEAQKVICTVTGYAQQNAIPMFSYKDWPYITPYPSPPMFGNHSDNNQKTQTTWAFKSGDQMLWEDTTDKYMAIVYKAIVKGDSLPIITKWASDPGVQLAGFRRHVGYWSYAEPGGPTDANGGWIFNGGNQGGIDAEKTGVIDKDLPPTPTSPVALPNPIYNGILASGLTTREACAQESALAYFALTKWYAKAHELGDELINGSALPEDGTLFSKATKNNLAKLHHAVNAARFLAHAALCVSRQVPMATGVPRTVGELEIIREAPDSPLDIDNKTPPFTLTNALVRTYYENCMKLVMRYAASYPYDWGAPRPTNRTIMMDFPLIQYDPFGGHIPSSTFFSAYNYGSKLYDGTAQAPRQWKIISAQPITNIGRSFSYPNQNLPALLPAISTTTTTPNHFTLARPFKPTERCRQIVFWAVDWQSYEDFETAPSAPVDASRYPKRAPVGNRSNPLNLMDMPFLDWQQFGFRNPEKVLAFCEPTATRQTGDAIPIAGVDNVGVYDRGSGVTQRAIFSGQYGADRNANGTMVENGVNVWRGRLDRGPVPKSTRLRAITVARFNYYDPRLTLVIR